MSEFSLPLTSPIGTLHAFGRRATGRPVGRVAIVHGYGDHAGRYREVMEHLAGRGLETYAIDLRGHGRSPGQRGFVRRWDDYLDDVSALLGALPNDLPTFLLGHSHGGLIVAVGLSRGRFQNIRGAVLTSPFFVNKAIVPLHKRWLAAFGNVFLPSLRVGTGLGGAMMTHDEKMIEESRTDALLNRCATPRWFVSTLKTQLELFENARRFNTPILTLIGDADPVADPVGAGRFHESIRSDDKALKTYAGLLHELLRESDRVKIFEEIAGWITARV